MMPVRFGSVFSNIRFNLYGDPIKPSELRLKLAEKIRERGERDGVACQAFPQDSFQAGGIIATLSDYKFPVVLEHEPHVFNNTSRINSMRILVADQYDFWVQPCLDEICNSYEVQELEESSDNPNYPTVTRQNIEKTVRKYRWPPWMKDIVVNQS